MPGEDTQKTQVQLNTSLLEDASVLLMFHNSAVTNKESPVLPSQPLPSIYQSIQKPKSTQASPVQASPVLLSPLVATANKDKEFPLLEKSRTSSNSKVSTPKVNHMASPGPAIAALAYSSNEEDDEGGQKNQKGMVAAAALAAAAGIPLPLMNKNELQQQRSIDDHLRSAALTKNGSPPILKQEAMTDEDDLTSAEPAQATDLKKNETDEESTMIVGENAIDTDMKDADGETAAEETQDEKQEPQEPQKTKQPVKRGRKPKRKPSASKDYVVGINSGIISCICSFDHDDGFTIQCEVCNRWQHAVCMGITGADDEPEHYSCSVCQPRPVDVKKAQKLQQQTADALKRGRGNNREKVGQEAPTGKDSSSDIQPPSSKPKTKPTPPVNSYGKNLEENDIQVPNQKNSYLTQYFQLKTYDYQDNEVYKYIKKLSETDESFIQKIAQSEYEETNFPTLRVKPYSEISNKKFNGISKLGLFTEQSISEDEIVGEYLGEINFKDRYIQDSRNQYRIWGVEKPYVAFISKTPLVIDARLSGSTSRFIRRSCNPNSDIKILNVDGELKFVIFTKKPIKANSELTLGWNWDINHSIRSILQGETFDQTPDADKPSLILSIESILTVVECACTSASDCHLAKVKRASFHIYRSSRKNQGSSTPRILQAKPSYTPIQQRLLQRELSNIRDSSSRSQHVSILSSQSKHEDVGIRPYLYNYLTPGSNVAAIVSKKRKVEDSDTNMEYLPIPLPLSSEINVKVDVSNVSGGAFKPQSTIKKLSFADYKKKKKPTV